MIPLSETAAHALFWGATTVAVFAQAMVLRAALAGRTPAASETTAGRAREVLWIILPAVTLALVLWFTWQALPRSVSNELTPAGLRSVAGAPAADAGGA